MSCENGLQAAGERAVLALLGGAAVVMGTLAGVYEAQALEGHPVSVHEIIKQNVTDVSQDSNAGKADGFGITSIVAFVGFGTCKIVQIRRRRAESEE